MIGYYYLAGKLLALAITASLMYDTADPGILLIRILVIGCLFALQILLLLIGKGKYKKWSNICSLIVLLGTFLVGPEATFPLVVTVGFELLDTLVTGNLFYEISAVLLLLLLFVYKPDNISILFTLILVIMLLLLRYADGMWQSLWKSNLEQKERLSVIENKLHKMREYAKTVETTAIMEERNRFASRIHDQLGHNISGSIILLEATAMSMDKDPQGAKKNVLLVTENLRKGVDDIRMALRQERPSRNHMSINEIKKELEHLSVTYGKEATLDTEGDLNKISLPIWLCMTDNLKEAITNMLKHSTGDRFHMKISCLNKLIRVEYHDNGSCGEDVRPGIGLSSIEERTAACGGTALYKGGYDGFTIITIYYR